MLRRLTTQVKTKGFTLVELLIVITIIGILAGMSFLYAPKMTAKSDAIKIVNNMKELKFAALFYYADHNAWPGGNEETKIRMLVDTYIDGELSFTTEKSPYWVWGGRNEVKRVWVKCFLKELSVDRPELRESLKKIANEKDIHLYNNAWDRKLPVYSGGDEIFMPVI